MIENMKKYVLVSSLFSLAALLLVLVSAHATIVFVTMQLEPLNPQAGESFSLSLDLSDPLQTPIEDAVIIIDARPEGAAEDEVLSFKLTEYQAGSYQSTLTLPTEGTWNLLFRDQTYKQEEARSNVVISIGASNPELFEFIFPPTATSSNNWRTWLIWLIALPIIAGVLVTIIVLNSNKTPTLDEAK